jgi:hypothetical protein
MKATSEFARNDTAEAISSIFAVTIHAVKPVHHSRGRSDFGTHFRIDGPGCAVFTVTLFFNVLT